MSYKKIIPYINTENEVLDNVLQLAKEYSYGGADELLIYNFNKNENYRNEFLAFSKQLSKEIDIPFSIGCYIESMEDVKKALYTGASCLLIDYNSLVNKDIIKQASKRFGANKIIISLDSSELQDKQDEILASGASKIMLKHLVLSPKVIKSIGNFDIPVLIRDSLIRNDIKKLLSIKTVQGIVTNFYEHKDLMKVKISLKEDGININTFESKMAFSELNPNNDGLVPVITQDYRSGEVLMLAYVNEDAYNKTIASGRMFYYSRSRDSLWLKGETSGHYQYLKDLSVDCDGDTLLAKVIQIGAACHTGNRSCFYTNLMEREYKKTDPSRIFEDVYNVILDRKKNPKEGSYTNYLFDEGIDKILKKCGEECAEIIIAAKNPETEELRYEIADFIYHLMVLMVDCGLNWNDIMTELEHRK